jgi:hypothetical protein
MHLNHSSHHIRYWEPNRVKWTQEHKQVSSGTHKTWEDRIHIVPSFNSNVHSVKSSYYSWF